MLKYLTNVSLLRGGIAEWLLTNVVLMLCAGLFTFPCHLTEI